MNLKKNFAIILYTFSSIFFIDAQVYWTETFGSGIKNTSVDGLDTGNGPWSEVLNGTQGVKANSWFASKEECGNDADECGSSCASDASLHVGSVSVGLCAGGDCGAAYYAHSSSKTDKDAISPDIDNTYYGGITLSFNYIGYGEGTQDVASWSYSCDGGTTWTFVTNLTTNCCTAGGSPTGCTAGICGLLGCQGRWTAYSYSLPVCADYISHFKIKFNWKNDNDANGNDPSFAVDDITLSYSVLPITLSAFSIEESQNSIQIYWSTQSEINNDYFTIERSFDGKQFIAIGNVDAKGNSTTLNQYLFSDEFMQSGMRYYRIKQIDFDKQFTYSAIIPIDLSHQQSSYFAEQTLDQFMIHSTGKINGSAHVELYNVTGNILYTFHFYDASSPMQININQIPSGYYLLIIKNDIGEKLWLHSLAIVK